MSYINKSEESQKFFISFEKYGSLENKSVDKTRDTNSVYFYFIVFVCSLAYFTSGVAYVWTSPMLPKLLSDDSQINPLGYPVNSYEISMIGGVLYFGAFLSPLFCGKFLNSSGRRNIVLVIALTNLISHVVLAFSTKLLWILFARLLIGICAESYFIVIPVFLMEVTNVHNRLKIGCFSNVFMPLGQLFGYVIGVVAFTVRNYTLICVIPTVVQILLWFPFVWETPVHLLRKGKRTEAGRSLKKYTGNLCSKELQINMKLLELSFEETVKSDRGEMRSLVVDGSIRRGFLISVGVMLLQTGSGMSVICSFMGPILEEAQTGLSGNMAAIAVGSMKVIIFCFISQVVEKLGRKPLLLFSSTFCSMSLFSFGLYFFLKNNINSLYQNYTWIPIATIFCYVVAYASGLGPISLPAIAELFTDNIRSKAISTVTFIVKFFNTFLVMMYPIVVDYIGNAGCMWIFGGVCALGAGFVYYTMPETKGKSFNEIQELLRLKKNCDKDKKISYSCSS